MGRAVWAMMEGATAASVDKLASASIVTPNALLTHCADGVSRARVARNLELSESTLLAWVNKVDLMRVRGIGSDYGDLLGAADIRSLEDLQECIEPTELSERLTQANRDAIKRTRRSIVRRTPSVGEVQRWIHEARQLDSVVEMV